MGLISNGLPKGHISCTYASVESIDVGDVAEIVRQTYIG